MSATRYDVRPYDITMDALWGETLLRTPNMLLGVDLKCDRETGDLVIDERTGDFEEAAGEECLRQDVDDALWTLQGGWCNDLWIGCNVPLRVGAKLTATTKLAVQNDIRNALVTSTKRVEPSSVEITDVYPTADDTISFRVSYGPIGSPTRENLVWTKQITSFDEEGQV